MRSRYTLASIVVAVALLAGGPACVPAQESPSAPVSADSTPLQKEIAELAAAPISHKVLRRLEQINDSLAEVEIQLAQRLIYLKAGVDVYARPTPVPVRREMRVRRSATSGSGTALYVGALGATVAANHYAHFIRDPGGYPRQWDQWTAFHFTAGYGIESLGESLNVPLRWRLAAACGALAAWESTKGYTDLRDIAAGCAGVLTSSAVRSIARRITG